jgi:hypothetical protein
MRSLIGACVLVAGLALGSVASVVATPVVSDVRGLGLSDSAVEQAQYSYCERLRRACVYRYERGEAGEGNCRRYRAECGGMSYCERLRQACIYKDERGESGEGNCRRYRNECR